MIEKIYKVYYTYINTDINDVMAGEKSQEEIERALSLFPEELNTMLGSESSVEVLEQEYASNYIIVRVKSSVVEKDFMRVFENSLKSWLFLAHEINE